MSKNLLIVESPAKARTIKKYLGPDFKIMASVGHVKDLPVKKLGVDIENSFRPEYVTIKGKSKVLKDLKEAGKTADVVYLAPDPDREGEAIAWHIAQELKKDKNKIFRVLFNELTAKAIREAVRSPQHLNEDKFASQQARRILDRLVGYQLSPLLWTRVKRGLSAGRVQSVAVKMICDREREIHAFRSEEYWSLTAHLESKEPPAFTARLVKYEGKKIDLKNNGQVYNIISEIDGKEYRVSSVVKKQKKKNAPPPFITSLLQQEAHGKLNFTAKKTMSVAQNLYEGIEIGERGQIGLITYMRTDSFRLSDDAVSLARDYILQSFGSDYLPDRPNHFKSHKGAQEAHEAIRPTFTELDPQTVSPYLTKDQLALYTLIWKRFIACQMAPAILDQTQADIAAGKATFSASGSVTVFRGFTELYQKPLNGTEPDKGDDTPLPPLEKDQLLNLIKLEPAQHFTQPPPRYTEATLIKALEENGIGRPSTYAAILANISDRDYVIIEKKRFKPTELGFLVTDLLVRNFPDILNTSFTAKMEEDLDRIERGEMGWTNVLQNFYKSFKNDLDNAKDDMKGEVPTDISCPKCNRPMVIKSGKNGVFLACTGYPECKSTSNFQRDEHGKIIVEFTPEVENDNEPCEKCGMPMVLRSGKFGPFFACSGYPECKNTRPVRPRDETDQPVETSGIRCKICGARMIVKKSRGGQRFLACEQYPKCTHTESVSTNVPCPSQGCKGMVVEKASKKGRLFYSCNQYPECRFAMWDEPVDEICPECGTRVMGIKRTKDEAPILACRKKGCGFTKPMPPS
ncbi:DNA topoisomerase 1 [uncultured Desulfobacterium sp.]|uniref:DNA topoisomerase 1 n=1 Tax=uncultured Desulfobacterium sp. TaxID=201089 RepID=A0A445MQP9_9BACT|nr:DNA topoisomerase 1 [uncultured Desulfobacterium sp.]